MIVLHLLTVMLVYRIAWRLSADRTTGLLAAALFALMPVQAEAVVDSYASLISSLPQLGAFYFYLCAQLAQDQTEGIAASARTSAGHALDRRRTRYLVWSMVLFGAALMSHERAMIFPALIAAHAFLLEPHRVGGRRWPQTRDALVVAFPYVMETAVFFGLRVWVLGRERATFHFSLNEGLADWQSTLALFALNFPKVVATLLFMLVTPWNAGPAPISEWAVSSSMRVSMPRFYVPALGLGMLCGGGYVLLRRHVHYRLYLFCVAWFLITLIPVLSLIVHWIDSIYADHNLYLPSFAFCVMAADLAVVSARGTERRTNAVRAGAIAILAICASALFSVQRHWHDDVALFSRFVEADPLGPGYHSQLGVALEKHGQLAAARDQLQIAASISKPPSENVLHELARVDEQLGDQSAAARVMAEWIKQVKSPTPTELAELALAADAAGDARDANAALVRAAGIPGGAEATALTDAQIRFRHGERERAEGIVREVLRRHPDDPPALDELGGMLLSESEYSQALQVYKHAIRITPKVPGLHYGLALTLHRMRREQEARDECAIALATEPNDAKAKSLMTEIERGIEPH